MKRITECNLLRYHGYNNINKTNTGSHLQHTMSG